jgi:hypothetical protein
MLYNQERCCKILEKSYLIYILDFDEGLKKEKKKKCLIHFLLFIIKFTDILTLNK